MGRRRGAGRGRRSGGYCPQNDVADLGDPRDVEIELLRGRIQELKSLHHDSSDEEIKSKPSIWDDGDEEVNPFA